MKKIPFGRISEIKKEKKFLERVLDVKIKISQDFIFIEGGSINEYDAVQVFEAIEIGFSARNASLITSEDYVFEKIYIKDYSGKKNLNSVRGRLIGTHGKTRKTIEEVSNSKIKIKENVVGVIAPADSISYVLTAIVNIIKGSKQSNMYKYLERINSNKKTKN